VPASPFKPNRQSIVLLSVLAGLVLGTIIAFLRDHLDNTFKTKADLEERLKLPVLGVLPSIKTRRRTKELPERHVLSTPRSPFSEAVNDVRTSVIFSHVDEPPKVVLVTSAVPDEGKTTLASNLALAFRKRGKTLLVDADLRKGRLDEIMGIDAEFGLTDMVSGQCSPDDAIVPDPEAEDLFVMTHGTLPPNPIEFVSSNRFANDLANLRKTFAHIIIDGTPLLPVSDSIVLSKLVDCVIVVVRADRTTRDAAAEAVKRLQAVGIAPAGLVMQQVDMRKFRGYGQPYEYGGYHGYYGYSSGERS
jgi:capsular exopolysaccharide synthesis family protein